MPYLIFRNKDNGQIVLEEEYFTPFSKKRRLEAAGFKETGLDRWEHAKLVFEESKDPQMPEVKTPSYRDH